MQDRLERFGIHIIVFLVARCQVLFMCPFIVPFIVALNMRGCQGIMLIAVALLGIYSRAGGVHTLRYGLVLLLLKGICKELYCKKEKITALEMAVCCGMFMGAISISYEYIVGREVKYIVFGLLEGLIAACTVLVYEQGVVFLLKKEGKTNSTREYIGGFAIGVTALFGCTQLKMPVDFLITGVAGSLFYGIVKRRVYGEFTRFGEEEVAITDEMLVQRVVGNRIYDFGQVFLSMEKMLALHEKDGEPYRREHLSNVYLSGDGVSLLNAVESQNNRLVEMRRQFIHQIGQVGEAMLAFKGELMESSVYMEYLEKQISEKFGHVGVAVAKSVVYLDAQNHLQIYVCGKAKGRRIVNGKELARRLCKIAGRKMICSGNEEEIIGTERKLIHFVEAGRYRLTTGIVRKGRQGERCCGDNFAITKLESQKAVLVISDGMGYGERAYVESQQIVDLLEQLLTAGFCRDLAIDLLNSFISFLADGSMSSSLDLAMIDFYTGCADFVKLGASTTFIKRKNKVECIRSTSLPVGMLEQVEFDTCKRLLYHGDIIVMVSDGVLDGVIFENKEEYLSGLIQEMTTCNAQVMAQQIMDEVVRMQRRELRDDSTVLVAAVWENDNEG